MPCQLRPFLGNRIQLADKDFGIWIPHLPELSLFVGYDVEAARGAKNTVQDARLWPLVQASSFPVSTPVVVDFASVESFPTLQ